MTECLKCKSQHVRKGRIENNRDNGLAIFRPGGLRRLALTIQGGTQLDDEAFACLDCGLVWSSTSPDKLIKFIKKHCDEKLDPNA